MDSHAQLQKVLEIPMIQALPEDLREVVSKLLLDSSRETVLAPEEVLYTKGTEDANTGALLVKGSIEVDKGGESRIVVQAPDLLGEMQQYNPTGRRSATVRATEESLVLEFSWHDFVVLAMDTLSKEEQIALRETISKHVGSRLKELAELAGSAQDDA